MKPAWDFGSYGKHWLMEEVQLEHDVAGKIHWVSSPGKNNEAKSIDCRPISPMQCFGEMTSLNFALQIWVFRHAFVLPPCAEGCS